MHTVIPFLIRHGYWVLAVNIFAEQIGLPIPSVPILLGMGALAGLGHFSIWTSLLLSVCAALASDAIAAVVDRGRDVDERQRAACW